MIILGREVATRTLRMVGIAVALLVVVSLVLWQCDKRRSEKAQGRVDGAQIGAHQESSADAINTVSEAGKNEAASEELTRENERDIRAAPGASDRVNSGVDLAGRKALCRRPAYSQTEQCKKLREAQQ